MEEAHAIPMILFTLLLISAALALGVIFFKDMMLHKKKKEMSRTLSLEGARKNKDRLQQIQSKGGARLSVSSDD